MIFLEYFKASQGRLRSRPISTFYAPNARTCDQAICIKCTYLRPQEGGRNALEMNKKAKPKAGDGCVTFSLTWFSV